MIITEQKNKVAAPVLVFIAFAIVYIFWGSTYFFIQKAMQSFPPFLLGALRFLIAGFILMIWCIIKGEKIIDSRSLIISAVSGTLLLVGGNGAVVLGEKTLPSAVVAILWSSQPLIFVLIDKANWQVYFKNKFTVAGLVTGFVGVIMLFSVQLATLFSTGDTQLKTGGMFLVIGGTVAFSIGSLYSKNNPSKLSSAVNVAWQMLFAGLFFFTGSSINHELSDFNWHLVTAQSWLSLIFLSLFGSIAAFSAYVWLLKVRPVAQVSTYAYVNPVVAVILGIIFAHEHIELIQILGLVVILISILLVNLSKYRKKS